MVLQVCESLKARALQGKRHPISLSPSLRRTLIPSTSQAPFPLGANLNYFHFLGVSTTTNVPQLFIGMHNVCGRVALPTLIEGNVQPPPFAPTGCSFQLMNGHLSQNGLSQNGIWGFRV